MRWITVWLNVWEGLKEEMEGAAIEVFSNEFHILIADGKKEYL
jgi:hypothetical protein